MPSIFPDYEKLVLADYHRKKSLNQLHANLMQPTRGTLKRESLRLCAGQIQPRDEKVIRDFCEEWNDSKTILQNIKNYHENKFRPLSNLLQGQEKDTNQKHIQLLAWLIDFPHRPYSYDKDYSSLVHEEPILADATPSFDGAPPTTNEEGNFEIQPKGETEKLEEKPDPVENELPIPTTHPATPNKWRPKKPHIAAMLLTVIGLSAYLWVIKTDAGGCMYWAGDHYQQIPCNQPMPHTLVIALDTVKVNNFKKITRPDTITHRSKGSIWYSKIDNQVEFFTSAGEHPEVMDRHLKPVSDYIIDTYIHPLAH